MLSTPALQTRRPHDSRQVGFAISALALACLLFVTRDVGAGPVLHERFEPDPAEDLELGATTSSGVMPAALKTRSGLVSAPSELDAERSTNRDEIYGGAKTPSSVDAAFHVDRLTTRPTSVNYDEPFRPSILPFKRLYAFDLVRQDFSFAVADEELRRVVVGGAVREDEDAFFADFEVDLLNETPVRIPSVGPGARVRALHVDPPQVVEILRDSADNWFARGHEKGRVRLMMQLSIEREVFGSVYPPLSFADLADAVPALPDAVRSLASEVIADLGLSYVDSPSHALRRLVEYFRDFEASAELPTSETAGELYVELTRDQKGVCRHRAYAFTVTAIALGIPTRLVHNEAHAWVEVYDGKLWHRVDLGGAATRIDETRQDHRVPNHQPPPDPFSWPRSAQPASALRPPRPQVDPDAATEASTNETSPSAAESHSSSEDTGWPGARQTTSQPTSSSLAQHRPADIRLTIGETRLLRGHSLRVSGRALRGRQPCRLSRIDLFIVLPDGPLAVGSVATDRQGYFLGQVTIPRDAPAGDFEIRAQVGAGCE